jgi:hypothetical protein
MHPADYLIIIIPLFVIIIGIIFVQHRSHGMKLIKPICYLAIFQIGSFFLIENTDFLWLYIVINLIWTPLAIDDFFNKSVAYWPFLMIVSLCIFIFIFLDIVSSTVFVSIVLSILLFRGLIFFAEKVFNQQFIGGADYLAAIVFISSLELYLVGYWVTLFSLLGILHIASSANLKVAVPLIPFMLASWCLVFSFSN